MKILNMTQHAPTHSQIEAGVIDPIKEKSDIKSLLTFHELPTKEQLEERALLMRVMGVDLIIKYSTDPIVLIGGAPWFMPYVEHEFATQTSIKCVYSFSQRQIIQEKVDGDTKVKKTIVFEHVGFVKSCFFQ